MRVLDIFSGIGGFSLGLSWAGGFETVGFCEIDPFCREVLAMHWPGVWIHDDIRTLTGDAVRERAGHVDLICGGFPCQPFSCAGKQKGKEDNRYLWPELARIIGEVGPRWFLLENVPNLRTIAADTVLADLEKLGYACWPVVVGAWAVGAPHKRDRVWIFGYLGKPDCDGLGGLLREAGCGAHEPEQRPDLDGAGVGRGRVADARCCAVDQRSQDKLADADRGRCEVKRFGRVFDGQRAAQRDHADGCDSEAELADTQGGGLRADGRPQGHAGHAYERDKENPGRWPARRGEPQYPWEAARVVESGVGRPAYGIPRELAEHIRQITGWDNARIARWFRKRDPVGTRRRKEQLKALGNAVAPQVVAVFGREIMMIEGGNMPEMDAAK